MKAALLTGLLIQIDTLLVRLENLDFLLYRILIGKT